MTKIIFKIFLKKSWNARSQVAILNENANQVFVNSEDVSNENCVEEN